MSAGTKRVMTLTVGLIRLGVTSVAAQPPAGLLRLLQRSTCIGHLTASSSAAPSSLAGMRSPSAWKESEP
jgi:hypothetical protein